MPESFKQLSAALIKLVVPTFALGDEPRVGESRIIAIAKLGAVTCSVFRLKATCVFCLYLPWIIALAAITGCGARESIGERWARIDNKPRGFLLANGSPVYRTNNPEPLAPDWDEPINADPQSFRSLFTPSNKSAGFQYACDAKKVFIGVGKRVYELENADPSTFKILDSLGYFSVDTNHVYYVGFKLEDADAGSFEVVGTHYGKDKASVFFGCYRLIGANPQRFVVLSEGEMSLVKLDFSGPGPFRKITFHEKRQEINYSGFWAKDDSVCFHGLTKIRDADANSFKMIDLKSAADKNWRFAEEGVNALSQFSLNAQPAQ